MPNLLETLADLAAPFDSVLARLWLIGPGDLCRTCPMAEECPDRRECLHLEASAGLRTTDVIRRITNQAPHSFASFARDHADAFRSA